MFPFSDVRNQRAIQRRLAAKRLEEELNDWRREVDAYNRVVSAALLSIDKCLLSLVSNLGHLISQSDSNYVKVKLGSNNHYLVFCLEAS